MYVCITDGTAPNGVCDRNAGADSKVVVVGGGALDLCLRNNMGSIFKRASIWVHMLDYHYFFTHPCPSYIGFNH